MVKLERMVLQNFKSFGGKTAVPFTSGFTVVAGPNGSGKSNIIDALTFVLGTSSARSIRAQKLQNLIFNGGAKRKPADFCEVALYLDNHDGKIPGEEKEIKIARHVTKSGISSYKINGRSATKSRTIDFLANANLSPDGYNIIMQGDVTRIIELSPKERREIIDEISGITEFNEKKELAVAKIEKVEARVREAMVIIAEKQKRVSQLKAEKENAERYLAMEAELKRARASLVSSRLEEVRADIEKIDSAVDDYSKQLEVADKELRKLDAELEKNESLVKDRGEKIIEKKDVEVVRAIERLRSDIMRKRDQISFRDMEIERLGRSVRDLAARLPHQTTLFTSVIKVPEEYSSAIEVAVGSHSRDLVVESDEIAARCVKYMKEKHIRRARFLPLNKIRSRKAGSVPKEAIGLAINLIGYDRKFAPAVEYVLGSTVIVDNIDTAKGISDRYNERYRMTTLDGDLIEVSGAIIGGYYEKTRKFDLERLKAERQNLLNEIESMEDELGILREKEEQEKKAVTELNKERSTLDQDIISFKKSRKERIDQKFNLQNRISKLRIDRARLETQLEDLKNQAKEFKDVELLDMPAEKLQETVSRCVLDIKRIGPVNMRSIEEYGIFSVEFEELRKKLNKLLEEKESVLKTIAEIETKRTEKFMETMSEIRNNFSQIYKDLTGGFGTIRLEEENNIDSGLHIEASHEGKRVLDLDSMSGGEKTLTSLAFLFAIMQHYSSPFYVLDEIDAALDKANTRKIANLIRKYSKRVQFIVISHNDIMTSSCDRVFGVTMEEGNSKIFGIEMP